MRPKFYWLLLPIALAALYGVTTCGTRVVWPYVQYEAYLEQFSKIEQVQSHIRRLAQNRQLRLYEKDRSEMALHAQGNPALYVALFFEEEAILSITNVGSGRKLRLTAFNYGVMPLDELEKLTQDVKADLETLGLDFRRVEETRQPNQR